MSKRNRRPSSKHKDPLVPSIPDTIALSQALQKRFIDLCGAYLRIKGIELIPPVSLNSDMLRWRTMAVRHKRGDFRNTEAELKSIKVIAQWTVDVNCDLRGQPRKVVEWGD